MAEVVVDPMTIDVIVVAQIPKPASVFGVRAAVDISCFCAHSGGVAAVHRLTAAGGLPTEPGTYLIMRVPALGETIVDTALMLELQAGQCKRFGELRQRRVGAVENSERSQMVLLQPLMCPVAYFEQAPRVDAAVPRRLTKALTDYFSAQTRACRCGKIYVIPSSARLTPHVKRRKLAAVRR